MTRVRSASSASAWSMPTSQRAVGWLPGLWWKESWDQYLCYPSPNSWAMTIPPGQELRRELNRCSVACSRQHACCSHFFFGGEACSRHVWVNQIPVRKGLEAHKQVLQGFMAGMDCRADDRVLFVDLVPNRLCVLKQGACIGKDVSVLFFLLVGFSHDGIPKLVRSHQVLDDFS